MFTFLFYSGELVVNQQCNINCLFYLICFVFRLRRSDSISNCEERKKKRRKEGNTNTFYFLVEELKQNKHIETK